MPCAKLSSAVVLLLSTACLSFSQGTFENFGFESASLVPISGDPYQRVQFNAALPGWTGYTGTNPQNAVLYNSIFLDTSAISIIDHSWPGGPGAGSVIQGNFTVILQAGVLGTTSANASLSQTGLIPLSTESLRFRAYSPSTLTPFSVALDGQAISLTPLQAATNYTLYAADVSALAGQTAELKFTLLANQPFVGNRYLFLDSIQFSDLPVPEPTTWGLTLCGAFIYLLRRKRKA